MVERQRAGDGFYFLVVGVPCLVLTAIALTVIFTHEPPVVSRAARPVAPSAAPTAAVAAIEPRGADGSVAPPSVPASTLVARAAVPPPAPESTPPPHARRQRVDRRAPPSTSPRDLSVDLDAP